jgi:hypothetical protein
MTDAREDGTTDEHQGHAGRIVLIVMGGILVGIVVLRRRSAHKKKRQEQQHDARLRAHGVDVEARKAQKKGLERATAENADTLRRIKKARS